MNFGVVKTVGMVANIVNNIGEPQKPRGEKKEKENTEEKEKKTKYDYCYDAFGELGVQSLYNIGFLKDDDMQR